MNGICLDPTAHRVCVQIDAVARQLADDAGLVKREKLLASLPGDEWRARWSLLFACSGLLDIFGLLALRNTAKTRVKAAVIAAGTPLTREEIAHRCGLSAEHAGSVLSSLPSLIRADKSRWGLAEWIDDEYEGIAAEIIQRIEDDGGVTSCDRLFDELPRKFGVSAASVHAYMQTPKFVVVNGHISLFLSVIPSLREAYQQARLWSAYRASRDGEIGRRQRDSGASGTQF